MRDPKARHCEEQEATVSQVRRQTFVGRNLSFERMTCSCSCRCVDAYTAAAAFFFVPCFLYCRRKRREAFSSSTKPRSSTTRCAYSRAVSTSTKQQCSLFEKNISKIKKYTHGKNYYRHLLLKRRLPFSRVSTETAKRKQTAWSL